MPTYKSPKSFPGIERLGPLGQALIERLFPADTAPMPGTIIGPRTPVPVPQSKSLLDAFRPWGKGLEKAMPSLFKPSEVPPSPSSLGDYYKALDTVKRLLEKP